MSNPSTYPVQIRFRDLDSYGHVNNAVYLTYLEEGRILFFKERVGSNWDWDKHGILLVKHEINYRIPLLLNDVAKLELSILKVGTKSFEVGFKISKKYGEEWIICTHGSTTAVCFDHKNQITTAIPEDWKAVLETEIIQRGQA